MAFFDELKSRAVDLAQTGAAKSKQVAELAKLNLNNASEEDAMKKAYVEIGKIFYEVSAGVAGAEYAELFEKVTTAKINIEENKSRIAELKTAPAQAEEPCCCGCEETAAEPTSCCAETVEESCGCGCEEPEAPAEPEIPED